jgi:NADPH:quinone reductase-like Zn-dependent oxidoreductase
MSWEQAAALPQAGALAAQGLIDKGRLREGQRLLINGAGGGVGTLGLQIAKTYGAVVTGVDSEGKLEMLRSLGFDHVVDYEREDFTQSERGYDVVLDVKTNRSILAYTRVLGAGGAYVTLGGSTGRILQAVLFGPLVSAVTKKRVSLVLLKPNKYLSYLAGLFEAGKLRPVIDGHYTLQDTPEAMRYFGEGKQKGKVVITVRDG